MAHAPLLRTNTAPVFQAAADGATPRMNTMSMSSAPRASQLSGSTAFTSTTSLNSLASASTIAPASGQVVATSNIINQKADASRSLFQICVSLKQRLALVPGFEGYLEQLSQLEMSDAVQGDPVEALWALFRTGHPLLTVYNSVQPETTLVVDDEKAKEDKKSKIAIFKFVRACVDNLGLPQTQSFVINDLTGTDTTGFVKVSYSRPS
jgi:cell division control protein 24